MKQQFSLLSAFVLVSICVSLNPQGNGALAAPIPQTQNVVPTPDPEKVTTHTETNPTLGKVTVQKVETKPGDIHTNKDKALGSVSASLNDPTKQTTVKEVTPAKDDDPTKAGKPTKAGTPANVVKPNKWSQGSKDSHNSFGSHYSAYSKALKEWNTWKAAHRGRVDKELNQHRTAGKVPPKPLQKGVSLAEGDKSKPVKAAGDKPTTPTNGNVTPADKGTAQKPEHKQGMNGVVTVTNKHTGDTAAFVSGPGGKDHIVTSKNTEAAPAKDANTTKDVTATKDTTKDVNTTNDTKVTPAKEPAKVTTPANDPTKDTTKEPAKEPVKEPANDTPLPKKAETSQVTPEKPTRRGWSVSFEADRPGFERRSEEDFYSQLLPYYGGEGWSDEGSNHEKIPKHKDANVVLDSFGSGNVINAREETPAEWEWESAHTEHGTLGSSAPGESGTYATAHDEEMRTRDNEAAEWEFSHIQGGMLGSPAPGYAIHDEELRTRDNEAAEWEFSHIQGGMLGSPAPGYAIHDEELRTRDNEAAEWEFSHIQGGMLGSPAPGYAIHDEELRTRDTASDFAKARAKLNEMIPHGPPGGGVAVDPHVWNHMRRDEDDVMSSSAFPTSEHPITLQWRRYLAERGNTAADWEFSHTGSGLLGATGPGPQIPDDKGMGGTWGSRPVPEDDTKVQPATHLTGFKGGWVNDYGNDALYGPASEGHEQGMGGGHYGMVQVAPHPEKHHPSSEGMKGTDGSHHERRLYYPSHPKDGEVQVPLPERRLMGTPMNDGFRGGFRGYDEGFGGMGGHGMGYGAHSMGMGGGSEGGHDKGMGGPGGHHGMGMGMGGPRPDAPQPGSEGMKGPHHGSQAHPAPTENYRLTDGSAGM